MVPEFQKPRVTEIHVRMDCNGCVQKIKKALGGINGIYDHYVDFPQQKITIIGWKDPEKITKAIKKTRKMATICNIEPTESPSQPEEPPSQPTEQEPEGTAQATESTTTQPHHPQPTEAGHQKEPPKDTPTVEQPPPSPKPAENNPNQNTPSTPRTKEVEEVHVLCHNNPVNPPNYGNRFGSGHNYVGHWGDRYHNSPIFLQEPQPVYVTHSYNTYKPSPYVTEYEYVRSPPRHTHYNRVEHYQNGNGNITSMFSDENPNACRIV